MEIAPDSRLLLRDLCTDSCETGDENAELPGTHGSQRNESQLLESLRACLEYLDH